MDDLDLARQLANAERTLTAISAALMRAVVSDPCDVRAIAREIYARDLEIDAPIVNDLLVALVGLQATKLKATPRQIWEQLWQDAPTDAWWNAHAAPKERE